MFSGGAVSQDVAFYSGRWTRNVERIVLGKLKIMRNNGTWRPRLEHKARKTAIHVLRHTMIQEFCFDMCEEGYDWKLLQWERRYEDFKDLINRPNVHYDKLRNIVETSEGIWHLMAETNPDYLVYKDAGEEEWELLKILHDEMGDVSANLLRVQMPAPSVQTSVASAQVSDTNDDGHYSFISQVVDQPTNSYISTSQDQSIEL